jgi:regulator of ribosome biosynthesis
MPPRRTARRKKVVEKPKPAKVVEESQSGSASESESESESESDETPVVAAVDQEMSSNSDSGSESSDDEPEHFVEDTGDVVMDLRNLYLLVPQTVSSKTVGSNPKQQLKDLAEKHVQTLFNSIFRLPTTAPDDGAQGRLAHLPEKEVLHLPRAKPVPKKRTLTKWESFAQAKGIRKRKRSKLVYDEVEDDWKRRYGYKRANDDARDFAIEHKAGDDPSIDPWTRMEMDRKERVAKNSKKKLANELRAADGAHRVAGAIDLSSAVERKMPKRSQVRGRKGVQEDHHVDVALRIAQRSTASMGEFDKLRRSEPEVQRPKAPKRDALFQGSVRAEKKANLQVFSRLFGADNDERSNFNVNKAVNYQQVQRDSARQKQKYDNRQQKRRRKNKQ